MRNFLLILILTFSFQTLGKADDIRDFQIEGISIGDSLLDHFKENEINEAIDESAKDRLYILKTFKNKNFDLYEAIQLTYKESDRKKIITSVGGVLDFPNNINKCKIAMYKIASELSALFPKADKIDWGKYDMPTKEGHYFPITFDFKNLSRVMVSCQDWNKKSGIEDNLKVALFSAKYSEYLQQQNK
tara:strand:+ start:31 stop:594 length:564 start_codon:yes stop_codon:yes gene_type:complete